MGYRRWRVDAAGHGDGEALLMSDYSPVSFDGCYFGPCGPGRDLCLKLPSAAWWRFMAATFTNTTTRVLG